jgi:acyl-CoA reductase-like NAD-dependent aldehyde dehydrogenase
MCILREEIFCPVLAMVRFSDKDALKIANDTVPAELAGRHPG